jgi:hypothetical protein
MEAQVKSPTVTAVRMFFEYGVGAPDIVRDQVRQAEARRDGPALQALLSVLHELERNVEASQEEKNRHGLEAILVRWLTLRRQKVAGNRSS